MPDERTAIQIFPCLADQPSIRDAIIRHYCSQLHPRETAGSEPAFIAESLQAILDCSERGGRIFVALCDGALAAYACAVTHENTWTAAAEGFVYLCGVTDRGDAALAGRLLAAVEAWAAAERCGMIRLEIREQHMPRLDAQRHGWRTSAFVPHYFLAGRPDPSQSGLPPAAAGIEARPAAAADYPFVYDLLAEAVWGGLAAHERAGLNRAAARENIERDLGPLFDDGACLAFVVWQASRRCAQATVQWHGDHPFLDLQEAELIDLTVLPEYGARGIGDLLTDHVLRECHERGVGLLKSTLVVENTAEAVVAGLRSYLDGRGWLFLSRIMYKCLGAFDK